MGSRVSLPWLTRLVLVSLSVSPDSPECFGKKLRAVSAPNFGYETTAGQCGVPGGPPPLTGFFWVSRTMSVIVGNNRQTVLVTPSGAGLCASGGAGGFVTYVRQ